MTPPRLTLRGIPKTQQSKKAACQPYDSHGQRTAARVFCSQVTGFPCKALPSVMGGNSTKGAQSSLPAGPRLGERSRPAGTRPLCPEGPVTREAGPTPMAVSTPAVTPGVGCSWHPVSRRQACNPTAWGAQGAHPAARRPGGGLCTRRAGGEGRPRSSNAQGPGRRPHYGGAAQRPPGASGGLCCTPLGVPTAGRAAGAARLTVSWGSHACISREHGR